MYVQSFRMICLKNVFSVFLGRIASDLSLPKYKLELEVKCDMRAVVILGVGPSPAQSDWSQLLGKND